MRKHVVAICLAICAVCVAYLVYTLIPHPVVMQAVQKLAASAPKNLGETIVGALDKIAAIAASLASIVGLFHEKRTAHRRKKAS